MEFGIDFHDTGTMQVSARVFRTFEDENLFDEHINHWSNADGKRG